MIQKHKAALAALLALITIWVMAGLAGCVAPVTSASVTNTSATSASVTTEKPVISPTSQPSTSTITTTSPPATPTAIQTTAPPTAPSATDLYLTESQAAEFARDRVGDSARILSVKAEFDDNPPIYEIELADNTYHYELEIHAITGTILEYERFRVEDEADD